MSVRLHLDDGTLKVAQFLGEARYKANRNSGVSNQRVGDQSNTQTDLDGMLAELAAAQYLNLWPDLSVEPRSGGVDLEIEGVTLDIKATRHKNGRLLATLKTATQEHADFFVLAIVSEDGRSVKLRGWAPASVLLDRSSITDLGHGNTYAIPQDELQPIEHLWNAIIDKQHELRPESTAP